MKTRPLISIDLETTGVDPVVDRIVEIGIVSVTPLGHTKEHWGRFNPGKPISAEATAVHGITDEMVKNLLPFSATADELLGIIAGHDLLGYNLRRLDLPMLDEEFRRCGMKLNLDGVRIIDAYGIWSKKAPKRLEDAVRVFCGRAHIGAHGAVADARATLDVMNGMLATYPDLCGMTEDELARYSTHGDVEYADLAGKLYRDKDGDLRYAFGKVKDVKVRDDMGYGRWMLNKANFPGNTNDVLEAEMQRIIDAANGPDLFEDQTR